MLHAAQAHVSSKTPSRQRRGYRRREPKQTVLDQLLAEHLETFLSRLAADPDRSPLPRFVVRELHAFLRCCILADGFARVFCTGRRRPTLVEFSCKGRGFCPHVG